MHLMLLHPKKLPTLGGQIRWITFRSSEHQCLWDLDSDLKPSDWETFSVLKAWDWDTFSVLKAWDWDTFSVLKAN